MAKYTKGDTPTPPPNVLEYVKRKLQEKSEAEALLRIEQEAEQDRLRGGTEAQEEAEAREKEGIAREEEAEKQ
jgi:hypothetical protein